MLVQFFLRLFRIGLAFYFLMAIACVLGTFAGFFGEHHWLLDLCSHFRLVYCLFLLPAVILVVFEKPQRWMVTLFGIALCLNLAQIIPMYFPNAVTEKRAVSQEKPVVTVLQMNVYAGNDDYSPIIQAIKKYHPDVLVLEEFMMHHAAALQKAGIFKLYPYSLRDLNTVNAVLSRLPLKGHMEFAAPKDENPFIVCELVANKHGKQYPFTLITVHPERATKGPLRAKRQIIFFQKVLGWIKKYPKGHPVLVAGDYNATPWSYPFKMFTQDTGLYSAADGFGPIPTFPRYITRHQIPWLLPLLPIDHLLANRNVHIVSRKALPTTHSDHLPTWTEFSFR